MKRKKLFVMLVLIPTLSLVINGNSKTIKSSLHTTRTIEAIVSTQWLDDNLEDSDLVILDVREPGLFTIGHIKGSINITAPGNFFECFFDPECGLWMELPSDDALFKTIGNLGITAKSSVVVISSTAKSPSIESAYFGITIAARVAITLIYAGIANVAILDGGYTQWAAEGRSTSTETVTPSPVIYNGVTKKTMFVLKDYVENKVGKSTFVDTREPNMYFGIEKDQSSSRDGHIPTSKVLSAPWMWTTSEDKAVEKAWLKWKDEGVISEMSIVILGDDMDEEIIVYCGVGGFASPVYYILSELLGYTNVKFYDGSMQEWTADPDAPVVKYKYE